MKFSVATALLLLLGSSVLAAPRPQPTRPTGEVAIPDANADDAPGSAGSWTVIVDNNDPRSLSALIQEMGIDMASLKYVYNNTAFKGFAGSLSTKHVSRMAVMSGLKTYEPEMEIKLSDVQTNAPWGLQRVSQGGAIQNAPQDDAGVAAFDFKYQFKGQQANLGKDVDIYMVDTGVNVEHEDFDKRASFGFTIDTEQDDDGHGSHTAGTAASTTFGLAKKANIIAVKVLGTSSGSTSDIIAGIDFVMRNHAKRSSQSNFAGSVASMSLGSPVRSNSLDEAVAQASSNGIHFSVAAGNENQNACNSSPASATRLSDVVAVGATTIDDERASFSNFGPCTTIFAPGQDITSTWNGGSNKINTISGTSMACPHVTGLMAVLLSENPGLKLDPAGMKKLLIRTAGNIQTDKGNVTFANNGFTSPAQKKLKARSFELA